MAFGINIDYHGHPKHTFEELLKKYTGVYLCMDDVLQDKEHYVETYQDILDIMKYGFEVKEIREKEISFIFHRGEDPKKKKHTMQLRHFLSNLIFWYPFMECDLAEMLDESFIHNFYHSSMDKDIDFIDDKILPAMEDIDYHTQSRIIDEITHHMTAISEAFSGIYGLGISIYSIIQADKRNPEIGHIMHAKLDPNMQPNEIEDELNKRTNRLIDLFIHDTDNDLKPLFESGNALSKGQFKEIAVMVGLKSDINGTTVPWLINENILVDGLCTPTALYLDGMSGRKALIMSKTKMGEPGAFSKKATTAATPIQLRQDYKKCNTQKYVEYYIRDAMFLKMLDKRYYLDDDGQEKMLHYKKDTHLIGHRVLFRSPCTCASKEGICAYCYGGLYELNRDLFSAGAYAAIKDTEPLGQRVLSSKHLQMTHSDPIVMNDEFYKNFDLYSTDITVRQDMDNDETLYIRIPEVFTEETEDTIDYYCTEFDVVSIGGQTVYKVSENTGAKLYLSPDLLAIYKKAKDKTKPISLESFDDESAVLFNVEVRNAELTRPIKNINALLNTNYKMGCKTIDEVCQAFAEQMLEAGINHNFVHNEMVIRALIRKGTNMLEDPDFGPNGDPEDYTILRLNDALFKNPSPTISLQYGYLKRQLMSPEFYEKDRPSHLDPLFVPQLSSVLPPED